MKNILLTICLVLILSTIVIPSNRGVAVQQEPSIFLHDQLLEFTDVQISKDDIKVPLNELSNHLNIPVETKKDVTYLSNIKYDRSTKLTTKDGLTISSSPIVEVNGILFISVEYIVTLMGYQIEIAQNPNTLHIYQDKQFYLPHVEFENHAKRLFGKKNAPAPTAKPDSTEKAKANVYLTFDDGPNKFTTINNSTLKKYNVSGTFFFLGNNMKNNKSIVKAVAEDGHYIGTHSMTHDKNKVYKSTQSFIDEMNDGTKLILQMTGRDAKLIRVPYGSKPHVTQAMKEQLNELGYKLWDWDVDSNDWKYTDKQAEQIVQNVQKGVEKAYKSGDRDIIVLLHDRSQSAKALPDIIEWLQKEGYSLKTYESEKHIIQNFFHDKTL